MFNAKQLTLMMAFILAGCTSLAPDYQPPENVVPEQFSLSQGALVPTGGHWQQTGWQTFFADPQAKHLIDVALRSNRDLRMAVLNVEAARAQYNVSDAGRYPQLNGTTGATYEGDLQGQKSTSKSYEIGLNLSYELDFFGKLKNMSEADKQNFFASQAAQRAAQIVVVTNVSQAYFNQRRLTEQMAIAKQTLKNYQQSYAFVEQQLITGSTNVLALEQARGVIESTRADIAKREGELAQASHALQQLLGSYSTPLDENVMSTTAVNPLTLPPNLPSTILLQRPDIMEAEHQLRAADANIGVARAAFFPSITLTSGISSGSSSLSSLFNAASGMWNFVPKLDLPIFNAGRNEANLALANVKQRQAVVNYEQKIQAAFKAVADTLSLRDSIQGQLAAQQRYLASLQITLQRAQALYASGAVSYIEVLDAQRSLFTTQQAILDLRYSQQVNEINLFSALGGGWKA
ncbi:Cu(I)/Ag(I) efflux RND transporter outer membrane protein [Kluyvera intermedia]|uniref:Cu(I)/Ag(I) efflux RND transporter outer membrane protein n=1 Tax=Kluyvera intermedia TaxID=61648 RepID=UPI003B9EDF5F